MYFLAVENCLEENLEKKNTFISLSQRFAFLRNGKGCFDQQSRILKIATWIPTTFLTANQQFDARTNSFYEIYMRSSLAAQW